MSMDLATNFDVLHVYPVFYMIGKKVKGAYSC